MFMKKINSFAAILTLAAFSDAAVNLNVSLGDSIKPVTHVATGSLYGLTETLPSNIEKDVAPLKPNVFLSPARSGNGRQQGIGGAFLVAAARTTSTSTKTTPSSRALRRSSTTCTSIWAPSTPSPTFR